MSLRNMRFVGDSILRKKARPVEVIDDRILELIEDMFETMYVNEGVGLAAPQVGILRRVIVIDVEGNKLALINPVLLEAEGEESAIEGCLSVPDQVGEVRRPTKVKVSGINTDGEEIEVTAEGFAARALCHEIDHLEGIVFLDRADEIINKEDLEEE